MPKAFIPSTRPSISREDINRLFAERGLLVPTGPFLVGFRGYMDAEGDGNDIGRYDDALALVRPFSVLNYNFNTDPNRDIPGRAHLKAGVWSYKLGTHGLSKPKSEQYVALVQAAPVTIARFQGAEETGYFGINIHRGGEFTSTGSEGCQTVYKPQWQQCIDAVRNAMFDSRVKTIPYILLEPLRG